MKNRTKTETGTGIRFMPQPRWIVEHKVVKTYDTEEFGQQCDVLQRQGYKVQQYVADDFGNLIAFMERGRWE